MSFVTNSSCCSNSDHLCNRCESESNLLTNDEPLPAGGDLTANESWQEMFEQDSGFKTQQSEEIVTNIPVGPTPLPQPHWGWDQ